MFLVECILTPKITLVLDTNTIFFLKITFSEFENWRESYEKDNYCSFIKKTGNRNLKHLSTYLYCSRSGVYEHKNAGKKLSFDEN